MSDKGEPFDAEGWIKLDLGGGEPLWLRLSEIAAVWREPPVVRIALRGAERTITVGSSQLAPLLVALIGAGP